MGQRLTNARYHADQIEHLSKNGGSHSEALRHLAEIGSLCAAAFRSKAKNAAAEAIIIRDIEQSASETVKRMGSRSNEAASHGSDASDPPTK